MVFLEIGNSGRTVLRKDDCDGGVSSTFLFVQEKLFRFFSKSRLLIVNGYHIDSVMGIHSKIFRDGVC